MPEISSPRRYGISRKPYVNAPENATVISSSTASVPSGSTTTRTSEVTRS
jgi:hypothetical protein